MNFIPKLKGGLKGPPLYKPFIMKNQTTEKAQVATKEEQLKVLMGPGFSATLEEQKSIVKKVQDLGLDHEAKLKKMDELGLTQEDLENSVDV